MLLATGQTYFGLDAVGNQVMVLDPMGRGTYYQYDVMNRVDKRYDGADGIAQFGYDARSLMTYALEIGTGAAIYTYDAAARLAAQGNGLGEYSYFSYDARGNRIRVMTPTLKAIYFTFDRLGRQTHKTSQFTDAPIFAIAYMGYDQASNQVVAVDEVGNPNYFTYDGLNRLSKSKDGAFNSTYFGFDSRSSTVLRLDPDGRSTYMTYDTARRLSRQYFKNPVAGEATDSPIYYVYNQASDLTIVDDRLSGLNVTYMDFDAVSRVTKKVTLAGAVYYAYDLSGRLTSLKDPRLVETQHVYDSAGRPRISQTSAGRSAYYFYDTSGFLIAKTLPGGDVKAYYSYDVAGRIKGLRNLNSSNALLTYFKFNRNANGSVTQIEHGKNDYTYFTYDNLEDPLTEFRIKNAVQVYGIVWDWDKAGRRITQSGPVDNSDVTYDSRNLLEYEDTTLEGTVNYQYDLAQRLKTRYSSGQATYFKHDQRNQIKEIRFQGVAGTTHYFHYNGLGERVVMIGGVGGTIPTYLAYNGPLLTERDASGTTYGAYRWGPGGDLIESTDIESGVTAGPAVDQRGSVNALPGASGGLLYDLYGEYLSETLASGARTRFLPPGQLRINTPVQMNLTGRGLYLVRQGILSRGPAQWWQWTLRDGLAGVVALAPAVYAPDVFLCPIPEGPGDGGRWGSTDRDVRRKQCETDTWGCHPPDPEAYPPLPADDTKFNCGGYAWRTGTDMSLLEALKRLATCREVECTERCRTGEWKFWYWQWTSNVYAERDLGPDGQPRPGVRPIPGVSGPNYHVVSHPAEAGVAFSKTGKNPIRSPKPPSEWGPDQPRQHAGERRNPDGTVDRLVRLQENVAPPLCYCCPRPW